MGEFFFSGSHNAKLDEKNRLVLPQEFRYGLIENGRLEFAVGFGIGGCLTIYRQSDIVKIAKEFRKSQHVAKYQKFFTLFFSTLYQTTCDKIGRFLVPVRLKNAVNIDKEVVIAGVLDRVELWPKDTYENEFNKLMQGDSEGSWNLASITEEAFSLLNGKEENAPVS